MLVAVVRPNQSTMTRWSNPVAKVRPAISESPDRPRRPKGDPDFLHPDFLIAFDPPSPFIDGLASFGVAGCMFINPMWGFNIVLLLIVHLIMCTVLNLNVTGRIFLTLGWGGVSYFRRFANGVQKAR